MQNQKKAILYGLCTIFLWSLVPSVIKLSLRWTDSQSLLLYSTLVATAFLFVVLCVQKKLPLLLRFTRREWLFSFFCGLLNPCCYYLLLFKGYNLLPAQQAMPINYTWAIALTLLSIPLLGQRVTRGEWLAIVVSYFGVLIIGTKGRPWSLQFDSLPGVCLLLLSSVIWALYWILNTRDKREAVAGLCANFLCALPVLMLYMGLTHGERLWTEFTLRGFAGGVWLGFFEMGIPFVCWLTALRLTQSTARIANLIFLAPVLSLVVISVVLGEKIHLATIVGLGFVLGGLLLQRSMKN